MWRARSRCVIAGAALHALADLLDLARVTALVHAALAPLTVRRVGGRRGGRRPADGCRGRRHRPGLGAAGGHPDGRLLADLARQAAEVISARADIHRLVPGGMGVTAAP